MPQARRCGDGESDLITHRGPFRKVWENRPPPGLCSCGQNSVPGVSGQTPPRSPWQPGEDGFKLLEASHSPRPTEAWLHPQSQQGQFRSSHSGCLAPSSADSEVSRPHKGLM